MQKEELIQLHALFVQIKNEIEKHLPEKNGIFKEYEQLGVLPQHVHKSKSAHKKAIFILGKELAEYFSNNNKYASLAKMAQRLEKYSIKA